MSLSPLRPAVMVVLFFYFCMFAGVADASPPKSVDVKVKLLDLELVNHDAQRVRFKSDVVGERLVIISFTYSTCTLRPVIDSITTGIQNQLRDRLGNGVSLISMSIDPVTDIPQRLKEYRKKVGARHGWVFLTGKKQDVDQVLVGLDSYAPNIYNHPLSLLVGDARRGVWKRLFGFPSPEAVMKVVKELEEAGR